MPARLLITRPRGYLNFLNFCGSLIVSAIIFNIPLYFEVVRGDSPTVAGLRLIVPFLALPVAGFVSCMVINSRVWIRPAIICGTIMMLTGAICLACMGRKLSSWVTLVFLVPSSAGMGIAFPAINLCLLRTSPPGEHAMVTSTMFLIRRLGSVIGVALSTLVMQGTLLSYLQKLITGSHKAEVYIHSFSSISMNPDFPFNIILQIRESVRSIPDLSPSHQEEAITAYSAALRVAFASMIIVGVLLVAVALPVRLPDEDVTEERAAQA
ncbi:hypothetical protein MMC12_003156 [Toensbergia leucococca]|nr:hypothetical protein [Toensbergia leucococca]